MGHDATRAPLAAGSVSLAVSVVGDGAREQAATIVAQARAAEEAGFDGVTMAEHHAGFEAYMPQPLLAATWILAETDRLWVAPCPVLLSIRHPNLVAEQIAWTAARFPGRLGVGVGAGYMAADLEPFGRSAQDAGPAYLEAAGVLMDTLAGKTALAADPALRNGADVPVVSASNSPKGVRRAAEVGMGLALVGGADSTGRTRSLLGTYHGRSGSGPLLYTRRTWAGELAAGVLASLEEAYRQWRKVSASGGGVLVGAPDTIAEQLLREAGEVGPVGLNVRLHVPGASGRQILEQIAVFGEQVLPRVRDGLQEMEAGLTRVSAAPP